MVAAEIACTGVAGGTTSPTKLAPAPAPSETIPSGEPEPQFPRTSYAPTEFWQLSAPGGFNAESYDSLPGMTKAADAVVTGTADAIRHDPDQHPDLDPADGAFATIEFKVEDVLAGAPQYARPGVVNVEVFMTDPRQFQRFSAGLPADRVMLFLRNKAVEAKENGWPPEGPDAGHLYYRIVSENGVIQDVEGAAVPSGAGPESGGWLAAIAKQTFSRVMADVRAAAG